MNAFQQIHGRFHDVDRHVQRSRHALQADPIVHRLDDHSVFLNGREAADTRIVGVAFVVGGDDAVGGCLS
jgi:hypothetical protein